MGLTKRIRVGVIGAGQVAALHLAALAKVRGVEVVGVTDVDLAAARATAERWSIPYVVDDLEGVLDLGVEAVHNCTPNRSHAEVDAAALRARRHLLAEKPLAVTSTESRGLVALEREAASGGVIAAVCFTRRHLPAIKRIRGRVDSGEYGPVSVVRAGYAQDWLMRDTDWNWRLDPAISGPSATVADIGSHVLDLVEHLAGQRIVEVVADLRTLHAVRLAGDPPQPRQVENEDHAAVLGRLEDGVQVAVALSQVTAGHRDNMSVELTLRDCTLAWSYEKPRTIRVGSRQSGFASETVADRDGKAFTYAVRDFYRAIRRGKIGDLPLASFSDGHHSVCLVEAILASHLRRAWQRVENEPFTIGRDQKV